MLRKNNLIFIARNLKMFRSSWVTKININIRGQLKSITWINKNTKFKILSELLAIHTVKVLSRLSPRRGQKHVAGRAVDQVYTHSIQLPFSAENHIVNIGLWGSHLTCLLCSRYFYINCFNVSISLPVLGFYPMVKW